MLAERGIDATCLVVADDENLDIAREFGFETLEVPNEPLGRKWNEGIEDACVYLGADLVGVVGSDDWIHEDLFSRLPAAHAPEPCIPDDGSVAVWDPEASEAITGHELALVDLVTGRLRRCRSRGKRGVIPWVLPLRALEPSGFRPVRDDLMRGLDGSMAAGLGVEPQWVFHDPHDLCRVDFKSDVNLNSYEQIAGSIGYGEHETDPWSLLEERYPADLVALARSTHQQLSAQAVAA